MSVFSNNLLLGAGGQSTGPAPFDPTVIGNSVWLDGSADTLAKTFSSGSAQTKVVISTWVQRNSFGTAQDIFSATGGTGGASRNNRFSFQADDTIDIQVETTALATIIYSTTRVFRDIGWYHVLVSIDEGSITSDQTRLYINGEQVDITVTTLSGTFSAALSSFGNAALHNVGSNGGTGTFLNGYQAQTTMLVGQSIQNGDVAVTDFLDSFTYGTHGSQFAPKKDSDVAALASTAGGNSFCLDFSNSGSLGLDISTLANNFTPSASMDSTNQVTSSPSIVYPVWNALEASATLSNGNLNARSTTNQVAAQATQSVSSGKFYWEITANSSANQLFGITGEAVSYANRIAVAFNYSPTVFFYGFNGNIYQDGSSTAYDSAISVGDVIGIAVDFDAGKIWFAKNNAWLQSGDPANGTSPSATFTVGTFTPSWCAGGASGDRTGATDFGQLGFTYTPPTDFVSLNSANLTAPDYQGIDYFDSTLYEGNGQNQRVGDFVPFTDTFTVANSAMFDSGDRRYLARTYTASDPARSSNSQATISYWIKLGGNLLNEDVLTTSNSAQTLRLRHYIDDQVGQKNIYMTLDGPSTNRNFIIPSGLISHQEWTHVLYNLDVDNGTAADKIKCWINGVQQTSTDTSYQSASSADYFLFDNEEHFVGNLAPASAGYTAFCLNSYLAELNVLDGQLKAPGDFGELDTSTNRWIPKDYNANVGTYGNRGFYMEFLNPTGTGNGVGTDSSGNGFNFTESNVSGGSAWATSDQFIDTPSKNYPTIRPVAITGKTYSEGNLKVSSTSTFGNGNVLTTPSMPLQKGGKWYWEIIDAAAAANQTYGIAKVDAGANASGLGGDTKSWGFYNNQYRHNGNIGAVPDSPTNTGTRYMFAVDVDAGKFWMGNDGTWWKPVGGSTAGDPAAGTNAAFTDSGIANGDTLPAMDLWSSDSATFVFTQNNFAHSVPTGFSELNQDNLDDTASKITALAWIKNRDATDSHILVDRVRGVGEVIHSNETAAEATEPNTVQRFLQRGVQVGNDVQVNTASESYVLWQWLLGDSATTGTVIPADNPPSIASTVIVADADHMSIGTYTGTGAAGTVGHGLTGAAELYAVKNLTDVTAWLVGSAFINGDQFLELQATKAVTTNADKFSDYASATVLNIGNNNEVNGLNDSMSFMAWRSVAGVCKVGSYNGNSSDDGPYLSLGFKPAWWMVKETTVSDASHDWFVADSTRYIFNGTTTAGGLNGGTLEANDSTAEEAHNTNFTDNPAFDFLADGIKLRSNSGTINYTGRTYIYLAMADIGGNGTLPPVYGR